MLAKLQKAAPTVEARELHLIIEGTYMEEGFKLAENTIHFIIGTYLKTHTNARQIHNLKRYRTICTLFLENTQTFHVHLLKMRVMRQMERFVGASDGSKAGIAEDIRKETFTICCGHTVSLHKFVETIIQQNKYNAKAIAKSPTNYPSTEITESLQRTIVPRNSNSLDDAVHQSYSKVHSAIKTVLDDFTSQFWDTFHSVVRYIFLSAYGVIDKRRKLNEINAVRKRFTDFVENKMTAIEKPPENIEQLRGPAEDLSKRGSTVLNAFFSSEIRIIDDETKKIFESIHAIRTKA